MQVFYRFVNILNEYDDKETLWKIMKRTKLDLMSENCKVAYNVKHPILPTETIEHAVRALEEELGINSSGMVNGNITDTTLTNAAEKFIYLTTCSKTMELWYAFFDDLFKNHPLGEIILALNRIQKSPGDNEGKFLKMIAKNSLLKIKSEFALKFQQNQWSLLKGTNKSSRNELKNQITGVQFQVIIFISFWTKPLKMTI